MALGNGLYSQLVMILWRDSYDKKGNDKSNIYNFQGQSARKRYLFDLDYEWLEENFITRETGFYKNIYQNKFRAGNTKTYQIFGVPIGNAKMTRKI